MFFVIFSIIYSSLREVRGQDNSYVFIFFIVVGWYLDAGVCYQNWRIIRNILNNIVIFSWSVLSICSNAQVTYIQIMNASSIDSGSFMSVTVAALLSGLNPQITDTQVMTILAVKFDSSTLIIIGALLASFFVYQIPLLKNKKKLLIRGFQYSAISTICVLFIDIFVTNSTNSNNIIINVNTLPFFMIVNTVVYAQWYYYELKK